MCWIRKGQHQLRDQKWRAQEETVESSKISCLSSTWFLCGWNLYTNHRMRAVIKLKLSMQISLTSLLDMLFLMIFSILFKHASSSVCYWTLTFVFVSTTATSLVSLKKTSKISHLFMNMSFVHLILTLMWMNIG